MLTYGFETDRLKTGTPARVDSRSVDYTNLQAQPGDEHVRWFSFDEAVGSISGVIKAACLMKGAKPCPIDFVIGYGH